MKVIISFDGAIIVEVDDSYKPIDSMSEEAFNKLIDDVEAKGIILDGVVEDIAECWEG